METVSKSKWGYHPCDRETYFALKRLRHLWYCTLRRECAHNRWAMKDPHNRVIRRKLRNSNGQCVGYEPTTTPMSEPKVPDFSTRQNDWIDRLYFEAKHPKTKPEDVKPFQAKVRKKDRSWEYTTLSCEDTVKKIHDTLDELSAWFEENGVSPKWSEKEKRIVVAV